MNRRSFVHSLFAGSAALAATPHRLYADGTDTATSAAESDSDTKKKSAKQNAANRKQLIFPAALRQGATVGIPAPASGVSKDEILAGVRSLEALGLNVVLGKSIYRGNHGFLAAPDEVRVAEFMEFVQRKDIDAIICARGGYGVMRILPMLDYDIIRDNPKIIMGYSDITALVNTIFMRSNMIAFHGPVAAGEMDDFTRESVVKTLFTSPSLANPTGPEFTAAYHQTQQQEQNRPGTENANGASGEQQKRSHAVKNNSTTKESVKKETTNDKGKKKGSQEKIHAKGKHSSDKQSSAVLTQLAAEPMKYSDESLTVYGAGGKSEGRLVGGNLTIVCATLGTPFEIQTADKILFLEDVNEEPYRVDRMLTQLWLCSKLQQCAGIVLGKFARSESSGEYNPSFNLEEVLRSRLAPLGIPVVGSFQFGHVKSKFTLPVGALAELDADTKKLTILEKPVISF